MTSPIAGASHIGRQNSRVFMKAYSAGSPFSRPATSDAMNTLLAGTAAVQTVKTVANVTSGLDGLYFFVSSPENTFGVWFDCTGSTTQPTMTGATAAIKVPLTTTETAAEVAAAIVAAMSHLPDFSSITIANDDEITFTVAQGGVCADATAGTSGFSIDPNTSDVSGAGAYMEIGECNEDMPFNPSPEEIKTRSGNTVVINTEYEVSVTIMNVNERMRDILGDYDGHRVTLVFADFGDTSNIKSYVIENVIANFSDDPHGDTRSLILNAKKTVSRSLDAITYVSYDLNLIK